LTPVICRTVIGQPTFAKAVNDVRDGGLSVRKSAQKWGTKKINTAGSIEHPPPGSTLRFVHQTLVAKPLSIHKSKRKYDKHAAEWLTHQLASSVFVEKSCFVDYENWARCTWTEQLKSFGKNGIILKIRRSSGKSLFILKVSKWAISKRNFRNF